MLYNVILYQYQYIYMIWLYIYICSCMPTFNWNCSPQVAWPLMLNQWMVHGVPFALSKGHPTVGWWWILITCYGVDGWWIPITHVWWWLYPWVIRGYTHGWCLLWRLGNVFKCSVLLKGRFEQNPRPLTFHAHFAELSLLTIPIYSPYLPSWVYSPRCYLGTSKCRSFLEW